jgi:hypothetical protein
MTVGRLTFALGTGSVGALLLFGSLLILTTITSGNTGTERVQSGSALPSIELAPEGIPDEHSAGHGELSLRPID